MTTGVWAVLVFLPLAFGIYGVIYGMIRNRTDEDTLVGFDLLGALAMMFVAMYAIGMIIASINTAIHLIF